MHPMSLRCAAATSTRTAAFNCQHSPRQRRHLHASTMLGPSISILPRCVFELRRLDDDLLEHHPSRGHQRSHMCMNARTEAKHQPSVLPIEHQVSAREQDFAWRRDGHAGIMLCDAHSRSTTFCEVLLYATLCTSAVTADSSCTSTTCQRPVNDLSIGSATRPANLLTSAPVPHTHRGAVATLPACTMRPMIDLQPRARPSPAPAAMPREPAGTTR
jgi:hypothetical protein